MKRDLFVVSLIWLVLTIAGLVAASVVDLYPVARSDKGEEIERAFQILLLLSMPVLAMVIAVVVYTLVRRSSWSEPDEDGLPLHGRGAFPIAWLAVTSALTIVVMVFGLITLPKVMAHEHHADLRVEVEGIQWTWLVNYPDQQVSGAREIVLPIDRTVTFDITSRDVLHSFWIPAFLMKIDAVPGLKTSITLKPTKTGTFQSDPNLRVQCTQLCGTSHSRMRIPVRVVSQQEFDDWVAGSAKPATPAATPSGPTTDIMIMAKNVKFDLTDITVAAGATIKLTVHNEDNGVPHNWALYKSKSAAAAGEAPITTTPLENGPVTQELVFAAPAAGEYYFRCDVHPATMAGTFIVR